MVTCLAVVYFESLDSSEAESTNETDLSSMSEAFDDINMEEEDDDQNGAQNPPLRYINKSKYVACQYRYHL